MAVITDEVVLRMLSAIAIVLLAHLIVTLLMVLRRVFLFAQDRLDAARAGKGRDAGASRVV